MPEPSSNKYKVHCKYCKSSFSSRFHCGLLYDARSELQSFGWYNSIWWMGVYLKGRCHGPVEILFQHLWGKTAEYEENHQSLWSVSQLRFEPSTLALPLDKLFRRSSGQCTIRELLRQMLKPCSIPSEMFNKRYGPSSRRKQLLSWHRILYELPEKTGLEVTLNHSFDGSVEVSRCLMPETLLLLPSPLLPLAVSLPPLLFPPLVTLCLEGQCLPVQHS
jgi:hypothetical protein